MKYGVIAYSRMMASPTTCNLGDIAQSMAVRYIYQEMGVPDSEIKEVSIEELGTYRGELVRLPINGYFQYSRECMSFPTSENIEPVFLSVYCTSPQYLKKSEYWKRNEPIACRDECTAKAMKERGYDAFLMGCMTMLFPKRSCTPKEPKVFIVDAHPSIEPFVPEELRPRTVYLTHDVSVNPKADKWETAHECANRAREVFDRYRDEAGLIITSRLHCAAPCIAMGIPTIVVKDGYDERYSWLDRFIHLYTPDEYAQIDWNPSPVEIEEFKSVLMRWAVSRMRGETDRDAMKQIEDYYMKRNRKKLSTPIQIRAYSWLAEYAPGLAGFLREKVLFRFTITANSRKRG